MVKAVGVRFESVSVGKLRRYFSLENFVDFLRVPTGVLQALIKLRSFKPDVVFSKGGYVSLPVVFAAWILRVPVVVHESDVSLGLANKLAFKVAKRICLSFEESKKHLSASLKKRSAVTGSPIRDLKGSKDIGLKFLGFDEHRPVMLVMGGSQGARQINELIDGSLDGLLKKWQIAHIRGKGNLNIGIKKRGYKQFEYISKELGDVYAATSLVISRGGANSLLELASLKKRVLVIPYSGRGEQTENASVLARKFGWSILSGNIGGDEFEKAIEMLALNKINTASSVSDGTKQIVDLIIKEGE